MLAQIIPTLAEERLERIADTAVGTGSVKKHDGMNHQRSLQRQAEGDRARPATVQDLAAVGIHVVKG